MRAYAKVFFYWSAVLLITAAGARAQEETEQQRRLAEINAKVEAETQTLEETSRLEQSLSKALKELQDNVKKLRAQEASLLTSLEEKSASADKLRVDLTASQERLAYLKQASLVRLRTIYMHNHQSFLESVLLVSDQNNLRRHAYFLSKIRNHDQKLLDELVGAVLTKAKQAKSLSRVIDEQARLKTQISAQRASLSKKLQEQEKVVANLRSERTKLEASIASLKAQAVRLETVLVSLTSEDEPVDRPAPVKDTVKKSGDFIGAGLMALRGKLLPPVTGSRQAPPPRDKRTFKDMVAVKGVHFDCPAGEDVKAIAPGRVIYVGRMPGLGNLAIVDHGQRFYSLYGGVTTVAVSLGEDLTEGGRVAECGGGDEPSRLYFEIRKNGTPVNVKDYLQPG